MSRDHSLYTPLTEVDISSCRQLSSLHFCNEARPIYKAHSPDCMYSLFTNIDISQHCNKHISSALARPIITKSGNDWFYASSHSFLLTIICPDTTKTVQLDLGVGVITLPPSCRASTKFALLPPSQTLKLENVHTVNFTLSTPFNLTLTPIEDKIVLKFQNDTLYQNLLTFNNRPIPIASLNSELGSLREIERTRKSATTWWHASSYVSISITVCFVIALCVVFACWYLLRENRDRHGRDPNAHVGIWGILMGGENRNYRNQNMPLQEQISPE